MSIFYYNWDFSLLWYYLPVFLKGMLLTLLLTGIAIVFGTALGVFLGIFLSKYNTRVISLQKALLILIDVIRALPLLILLLLFNYYLSYLTSIKSPFWIAILALSVNLSAFVADVLRAAIDGVPQPLVEAGYALGMDRQKVVRRIVLPEAIRQVIPSISLLYIDILKLSSLASVIAVGELVHIAAEISTSTFRYLEVFAMLALLYIVLIMPFSFLARKLEKSRWLIRRS